MHSVNTVYISTIHNSWTCHWGPSSEGARDQWWPGVNQFVYFLFLRGGLQIIISLLLQILSESHGILESSQRLAPMLAVRTIIIIRYGSQDWMWQHGLAAPPTRFYLSSPCSTFCLDVWNLMACVSHVNQLSKIATWCHTLNPVGNHPFWI